MCARVYVFVFWGIRVCVCVFVLFLGVFVSACARQEWPAKDASFNRPNDRDGYYHHHRTHHMPNNHHHHPTCTTDTGPEPADAAEAGKLKKEIKAREDALKGVYAQVRRV